MREKNWKNRMKKLVRPFASLAGFMNPRHSTKTGRASGRTRRKSLIINDQFLHPHPNRPEISGFALSPFPNLSEVIRSFALKLVLQALASALRGRCNPIQHPPKTVAPCCSVLQRVAPCFAHLFFRTAATPSLSRQSQAGAWWYCRDVPQRLLTPNVA